MISFATEQTIERSADDVWAYAADIVRHPEWMDVTAARVVDGGGTEVGARALERLKLGPRSVEVAFEVHGLRAGAADCLAVGRWESAGVRRGASNSRPWPPG